MFVSDPNFKNRPILKMVTTVSDFKRLLIMCLLRSTFKNTDKSFFKTNEKFILK